MADEDIQDFIRANKPQSQKDFYKGNYQLYTKVTAKFGGRGAQYLERLAGSGVANNPKSKAAQDATREFHQKDEGDRQTREEERADEAPQLYRFALGISIVSLIVAGIALYQALNAGI